MIIYNPQCDCITVEVRLGQSPGKAVESLLAAAVQLVSDAELLALVAETACEENRLTKELRELRSRLQLGLTRVQAIVGKGQCAP
jgi:hypothetical protein